MEKSPYRLPQWLDYFTFPSSISSGHPHRHFLYMFFPPPTSCLVFVCVYLHVYSPSEACGKARGYFKLSDSFISLPLKTSFESRSFIESIAHCYDWTVWLTHSERRSILLYPRHSRCTLGQTSELKSSCLHVNTLPTEPSLKTHFYFPRDFRLCIHYC